MEYKSFKKFNEIVVNKIEKLKSFSNENNQILLETIVPLGYQEELAKVLSSSKNKVSAIDVLEIEMILNIFSVNNKVLNELIYSYSNNDKKKKMIQNIEKYGLGTYPYRSFEKNKFFIRERSYKSKKFKNYLFEFSDLNIFSEKEIKECFIMKNNDSNDVEIVFDKEKIPFDIIKKEVENSTKLMKEGYLDNENMRFYNAFIDVYDFEKIFNKQLQNIKKLYNLHNLPLSIRQDDYYFKINTEIIKDTNLYNWGFVKNINNFEDKKNYQIFLKPSSSNEFMDMLIEKKIIKNYNYLSLNNYSVEKILYVLKFFKDLDEGIISDKILKDMDVNFISYQILVENKSKEYFNFIRELIEKTYSENNHFLFLIKEENIKETLNLINFYFKKDEMLELKEQLNKLMNSYSFKPEFYNTELNNGIQIFLNKELIYKFGLFKSIGEIENISKNIMSSNVFGTIIDGCSGSILKNKDIIINIFFSKEYSFEEKKEMSMLFIKHLESNFKSDLSDDLSKKERELLLMRKINIKDNIMKGKI